MTHALAGRPIRSRMQRPAKFRPGRPARRRSRGSRGDLVGRPDPGRSSSAGPEHMFWLVNYSLNLGFAQSWDFAQSWAVERMFRTDVPELVFTEHLFDGCATGVAHGRPPRGSCVRPKELHGSCARELRLRARGSCIGPASGAALADARELRFCFAKELRPARVQELRLWELRRPLSNFP